MEFYSIWPYFACLVLLLAHASAPFFAIADTPPNPCGIRLSNLDGLRGFLAFGVFFHHAAVYHQYLQNGQWALPPSPLYTLIGQAGVAGAVHTASCRPRGLALCAKLRHRSCCATTGAHCQKSSSKID